MEEAYIFGSWARRYEGELGPPPADIDVLIVGDADPEDACKGLQDLFDVEVNSVVVSRLEGGPLGVPARDKEGAAGLGPGESRMTSPRPERGPEESELPQQKVRAG